MPLIFIGMPVYNGERFVEDAIVSLRNQSFSDWKLLISDNASTDGTSAICLKFTILDKRISYIKQETNIGAINNFKFLLQQADSPFFMWAAADDQWEPSFLEVCMNKLMSSDDIGWSFSNIVNIDTFGRVIKNYPSFNKYLHSDRYVSIINYVLDPECLGKANLIYGIYRLDRVQQFLLTFLSSNEAYYPASDVALNIGILCRVNLAIEESILFKKRYVRKNDSKKRIHYLHHSKFPIHYSMSNLNDFLLFKKAVQSSVSGTEYEYVVLSLLNYREKLIKESKIYFENIILKIFKMICKKFLKKY